MGIYEDHQIHTKTGSRPIRFQYSQSGPKTNPMAYNNYMNDLSQCVKDSKLANYANDSRMGNDIKTTDDIGRCLLPDL